MIMELNNRQSIVYNRSVPLIKWFELKPVSPSVLVGFNLVMHNLTTSGEI